ncbi:hypothetical protein HYH02_010385 [Chlamydomonas schloesseri]|uniref:ABC1 atypical kinase-like domain-containing protein n=1 Tax=Chlamydomonas schloesseri TaxID=2026947 RepID=A0A835TBA8_9CHLO|nr:hypothetical protein HYH02_010385 [Chlamydomonas schloesseri]|eukprot:KAG2440507.1 hypothetical protein HYH02_010385 [Chlamydomonas schloesseri]
MLGRLALAGAAAVLQRGCTSVTASHFCSASAAAAGGAAAASTAPVVASAAAAGAAAAATAAAGGGSAAAAHAARGAPSPLRRLALVGASLGVGAGAAYLVIQPSPEALKAAYLTPVRLARDVYTAAAIVLDYKVSLSKPGLAGEEREAVLQACHQRGADRLLQLCFANGGIYTKLGQHVGQLDHLLPEPYVETMKAHLLDRCPVSDIDEVRSMFVQDLGAPPEQLFAYFSPTPIASASLAQVHEARDHAGRRLAVKVQHAGLRESCAADVATVEALVGCVRWVFPDFDYRWLVDEIKENLPRELDFRHEAANSERCRANLEASARAGAWHADRVHVPAVDYRTCSPRILTMEFIDGVGVTDVAALRRLGASPREVSLLVAETFNEMIFTHGYVHCDPHAANMLVRKVDGHVQLVLLDHGLYKAISDSFRLEYAALWRALIFADADGIRRHAAAMNAGDAYDIFAAMLTQRPWEQILEQRSDHLHVERSAETRQMAADYMAKYGREISGLLQRMPRPLLLLLKTNDCLRSVDYALGQPVNNFVITARECSAALARERLRGHPGPLVRLGVAWERLRVETRMLLFEAMVFWTRVKARLGLGPGRGGPGVAVDQPHPL